MLNIARHIKVLWVVNWQLHSLVSSMLVGMMEVELLVKLKLVWCPRGRGHSLLYSDKFTFPLYLHVQLVLLPLQGTLRSKNGNNHMQLCKRRVKFLCNGGKS